MEWKKGEFTITDNQQDLDLKLIHNFLQNSYWAEGIPQKIMEKSIKNSLSFGLFHHGNQIGFGRTVTDRATFAYLADVFVVKHYQGRGLGKWLVSCILEHRDLQGLRRWMLATADAHGLYEQHGFNPLSKPEMYMEVNKPNHYVGEGH